MRKTYFIAVISVIAMIAFFACEKSTVESESSTLVTCSDTAYLYPDSLSVSCGNRSIMYLPATGKNIIINHPIAAIDTIVNSAKFHISYDSTGTEGCGGAIFTKANITCYQRYW